MKGEGTQGKRYSRRGGIGRVSDGKDPTKILEINECLPSLRGW